MGRKKLKRSSSGLKHVAYLLKLYGDQTVMDVNTSIREYIIDYQINGLQERKILKFGLYFMELAEINSSLLCHYGFSSFAYKIMKDCINIGGLTQLMATLIFKKTICVLFNLGHQHNRRHDKKKREIIEGLEFAFPECNFEFSHLNIQDATDEFIKTFKDDRSSVETVKELLSHGKYDNPADYSANFEEEEDPIPDINNSTSKEPGEIIESAIGEGDVCFSDLANVFDMFENKQPLREDVHDGVLVSKSDEDSDFSDDYFIDDNLVDLEAFDNDGMINDNLFDISKFQNNFSVDKVENEIPVSSRNNYQLSGEKGKFLQEPKPYTATSVSEGESMVFQSDNQILDRICSSRNSTNNVSNISKQLNKFNLPSKNGIFQLPSSSKDLKCHLDDRSKNVDLSKAKEKEEKSIGFGKGSQMPSSSAKMSFIKNNNLSGGNVETVSKGYKRVREISPDEEKNNIVVEEIGLLKKKFRKCIEKYSKEKMNSTPPREEYCISNETEKSVDDDMIFERSSNNVNPSKAGQGLDVKEVNYSLESLSDDEIIIENEIQYTGADYSGDEDITDLDSSKYQKLIISMQQNIYNSIVKVFPMSEIQKLRIDSFLTSYIKYLVKNKRRERMLYDQIKKFVKEILYKFFFYLRSNNKTIGKVLLSKILDGIISAKDLSRYSKEDFCSKSYISSTNELLFNKEIHEHPAINSYPCKKCAAYHDKNNTCRNTD